MNKKLYMIIECYICYDVKKIECCPQDQEMLKSNGYKLAEYIPCGNDYPAIHECSDGLYGKYRVVGYEIIKVMEEVKNAG